MQPLEALEVAYLSRSHDNIHGHIMFKHLILVNVID